MDKENKEEIICKTLHRKVVDMINDFSYLIDQDPKTKVEFHEEKLNNEEILISVLAKMNINDYHFRFQYVFRLFADSKDKQNVAEGHSLKYMWDDLLNHSISFIKNLIATYSIDEDDTKILNANLDFLQSLKKYVLGEYPLAIKHDTVRLESGQSIGVMYRTIIPAIADDDKIIMKEEDRTLAIEGNNTREYFEEYRLKMLEKYKSAIYDTILNKYKADIVNLIEEKMRENDIDNKF